MSTAVSPAEPVTGTGQDNDELTVALLEYHRMRLGLSKQDFARYIGTDPTTYSLVLSGKRGCGYALYGRIMRARPEVLEEPSDGPQEQ